MVQDHRIDLSKDSNKLKQNKSYEKKSSKQHQIILSSDNNTQKLDKPLTIKNDDNSQITKSVQMVKN